MMYLVLQINIPGRNAFAAEVCCSYLFEAASPIWDGYLQQISVYASVFACSSKYGEAAVRQKWKE